MKNKWIIPVLMLVGTATLAQKVDLDKYTFTAAFRDLPRMQIDTSFHTFDFSYEAGPLMKLAVGKDHPEESIYLHGWRKLPSNAHLNIHLQMEDLIIVKSDVQQREELTKDKSGNVTGKKIWYAPLLTYTYTARVSVTDYTGRTYQQYQAVDRNNQFQYKGIESPNKFAAANLLLNMFTLTTMLSKDVLYKTINQLSQDLSNNYGYIDRRNVEEVWILDSRKHPEYDDFRKNWGIIKNALFKMDPNEPIDGIREEVKPAIAYFERIRKEYNTSKKGDRKLRYATHYLLSKLYYYLDDPDNQAREASDLILNDYDSRDGRGLEEGAALLKEQLRLNKRTTRHFPLDVASLHGPRGESLYSVQ
jgi:hypothetical protein